MAEGEISAELALLAELASAASELDNSPALLTVNSANNPSTANKMDVPEDDPISGRIKNGK
jgi:hypothetical protein